MKKIMLFKKGDGLLQSFLFYLLIANPLLSLAFDGTTIYYHYVLFPLLFALMLFTLKSKKQKIILFSFLTILAAWGFTLLLNGAEMGKIHNHFFNFLDFILICVYFSDRKNNLEPFKNFLIKKALPIIVILVTIEIVDLIMFVTGNGFSVKQIWGGGSFFKGTSEIPHTFSYLMITVTLYSIVLSILLKKRSVLLLTILPAFFIYESGVRVALIYYTILLFIIVDLIFGFENENIFKKLLRVLILAGILFLIFKDAILHSDLYNKIIKRHASGNNSAGRTYMWKDLLGRYVQDPSKWMFGFGDDRVYQFSLENPLVRQSVWAHNDWIHTIAAKGLAGLLMYCYGMFFMIKSTLYKNKHILYGLLMFGFYFIAAAINGFYNYREAMLSVPIIFLIATEIPKYRVHKKKTK